MRTCGQDHLLIAWVLRRCQLHSSRGRNEGASVITAAFRPDSLTALPAILHRVSSGQSGMPYCRVLGHRGSSTSRTSWRQPQRCTCCTRCTRRRTRAAPLGVHLSAVRRPRSWWPSWRRGTAALGQRQDTGVQGWVGQPGAAVRMGQGMQLADVSLQAAVGNEGEFGGNCLNPCMGPTAL